MIKLKVLGVVGAALVLNITPSLGFAQTIPASNAYAVPAESAAYADIADLVTISPMIVDSLIRKTIKIHPEQAIGVPDSMQRVLVIADVLALIRGADGVSSQVKFLLDIPKDARGKIPKLKKQRFFIMGYNVTGRPGEIRLARPDALIAYSEANNVMVRSITKEVVQIDAPHPITGISSAFYSPGTVIGDGETQIFLRTQNRQPLSISVSSRAGMEKQWTVSTSELIEETAATPLRYSLLWYRLACGLPRALPPALVASGDGAHAAWAQADYKFVMDALGPCGRKR